MNLSRQEEDYKERFETEVMKAKSLLDQTSSLQQHIEDCLTQISELQRQLLTQSDLKDRLAHSEAQLQNDYKAIASNYEAILSENKSLLSQIETLKNQVSQSLQK